MYPLNNAAKMTSERLTNFIIDKNINHYVWNGETAIIIDNWRMMHGRSPANRNEKRELNRIYLTTI